MGFVVLVSCYPESNALRVVNPTTFGFVDAWRGWGCVLVWDITTNVHVGFARTVFNPGTSKNNEELSNGKKQVEPEKTEWRRKFDSIGYLAA